MNNKKIEKKSENKCAKKWRNLCNYVENNYKKYIFIFLLLICAGLTIAASVFGWPTGVLTILGGLLLFLSFAVLIRPLLTKEKIDFIETFFIVFCAFLLVSAVVTYAYNPPKENEPDKSGVVQIMSAVVGGLITLYGVGITIKFNRVAKEQDEISKAKPNVFPVSDEVWEQLPDVLKLERSIIVHPNLTNLNKAKRTDACYSIAPIYLENSDLSMCTFKGIGINDKYFIVFNFDNVMLKGSINCFFVDYPFISKEDIKSVQLVLGDMYQNTYSCYVSFDVDNSRKRKNKPIYIYGVKKMAVMDAEKYETFFNKYE